MKININPDNKRVNVIVYPCGYGQVETCVFVYAESMKKINTQAKRLTRVVLQAPVFSSIDKEKGFNTIYLACQILVMRALGVFGKVSVVHELGEIFNIVARVCNREPIVSL